MNRERPITPPAPRTRARVVGLGAPAGGDDAAGLEVIRLLQGMEVDGDVDLVVAGDPSHLVELLLGVEVAIIVDAVAVPGPPGHVWSVPLEVLDRRGRALVSTHGIEVVQAIGLARALFPDTVAARIHVVGIGISVPPRQALELSAPVAAAVPEAVATIHRLLA